MAQSVRLIRVSHIYVDKWKTRPSLNISYRELRDQIWNFIIRNVSEERQDEERCLFEYFKSKTLNFPHAQVSFYIEFLTFENIRLGRANTVQFIPGMRITVPFYIKIHAASNARNVCICTFLLFIKDSDIGLAAPRKRRSVIKSLSLQWPLG